MDELFPHTDEHHRNPADGRGLTATISSRTWSTPELGVALSAILLFHISAVLAALLFCGSEAFGAVFASLLSHGVSLVIITRIERRRGGSWAIRFGLSRRQMKTLLLAPLFYIATLPVLMIATGVWHFLLKQILGLEIELQDAMQFIAQGSFRLKILLILLAVIAAPLFEEMVFRGLLFPYLVKRTGLAGGTVLVSMFFALIHMHAPSFAPLFLLSVVLCLAYWRTGSLWVSIGIHALFNSISIIALLLIN